MFSSYDIARFSDLVYSEVISRQQFDNLNLNKPEILVGDKNVVFYKQSNFSINSGDVIFTHTGNLLNLFYLIRNLDKEFQLTLITHQSDTMINKKLYKKKPKCIDNWYALNVDYKKDKLNSLPLGIANEYSSKKNITSIKIKGNNFEYFKHNTNVYINFTESTNRSERTWIKDYFKKFIWADIENKTLSIEDYSNKIKKSGFVLCPWGNGVDSHRIWETLFLGSIPIVKRHLTFSNLEDLPIFFVDDFRDINEHNLKEYMNSIKDEKFSLEKLEISYWEKYVKNDQVKSSLKISINEPYFISKYFKLKSHFKTFLNSKLKIMKYYILKVKKSINLI